MEYSVKYDMHRYNPDAIEMYILFGVQYFATFDISFGVSGNGKYFLVSKA